MDYENEMDFENRMVAPEYAPEDAEVENPLRPRTLEEYIGQELSLIHIYNLLCQKDQ